MTEYVHLDMQQPDQCACVLGCRFNAEMAHELAGAQRPGVRSRFPQPLPAFEHTRAQLEVRTAFTDFCAKGTIIGVADVTFLESFCKHALPSAWQHRIGAAPHLTYV